MDAVRGIEMTTTVKAASGARVSHFEGYAQRLGKMLTTFDWSDVAELATDMANCAATGRQVFLCGNGGSAGNAVHLANDFLYAWSKKKGRGIRAHALSENPAVVTCLANDEGYDQVFSLQLAVMANPEDILICFSGSGNSPNILRALEEANRLGMRSYSVLGFDGGKAKELSSVPIHFETNDMQMAEDAQLIIGHMIMQYLQAQTD